MRGRGEKDEHVFKDSSSAIVVLLRVLCLLILFVMGIIIGLTSSSHIDRYFTSQPQSFYTNYVSSSSSSTAAPAPASIARTKDTYNNYDHNNSTNCGGLVSNCKNGEDCLSMDSFKMPKNLTHQMTDNELFWRASLVPDKPEYPFERVPKVAFMFLTRGPLPFLLLWEKFFKGTDVNKYSIYVHTNPGVYLNVTNSSVFYNRQIPNQDVRWGSVKLVDAERRLLGNALLDFSNERFVLLSESCIPIYNFPTIYDYLIGSSYSFLDSYDDPSRYGRGRYNRRMKPDIKLRDWRKGSQWFEIHRTLAIKVVSDTRYYNLFKWYCLPSCYPDEHYLPTFVNMFYGSLNANRTITYVDWSLGGPHPAMFQAEHITENLIQSIRNNGTSCSYNKGTTSICFLFARKFHKSALDPLLNLSSTLLGF